ncbi:hypothetical protein ACIA6C_28305 [Streptomyces sp. NPDC051578]|uniref:hypothetical protein n=1 Tax=Streptomyces sp. NPDC051578 TaxID=3365662 RepID=UPI0037BAF887
MSSIVTAEQIRTLWNDPNPSAAIDRGDSLEPVTKDDLGALASELDTDDEGYPLDDQWEIIADQLNSDTTDAPTSTVGHTMLDEIREARIERDRIKDEADAEFYAAIRTAVAGRKAPITAIAEAAKLSRERIYQIRDGRR